MVVSYAKGEVEKLFWHIRAFAESNNLLGNNALFNERDFDLVGQSIKEIETESERVTARERLLYTLEQLEWATKSHEKITLTQEQKNKHLLQAKREFMETGANLFMSRWKRVGALLDKEMETKGRKVLKEIQRGRQPERLAEVASRLKRLKELQTKLMDSYWATKELGIPKGMIKQPMKPGQLMLESFLPGSESLYTKPSAKKIRRKRKH